jgi:Holliday junction resolvasome RuvABC DNA-binding subunit
VQSALTNLGFKQSQARGRIEAVQRAGAPTEVADFLRAALRADRAAPCGGATRAGPKS